MAAFDPNLTLAMLENDGSSLLAKLLISAGVGLLMLSIFLPTGGADNPIPVLGIFVGAVTLLGGIVHGALELLRRKS